MVHSDAGGKYGENLAWSAGRGTGDDQAVAAVQSWYDEIQDYDWSAGSSRNGKDAVFLIGYKLLYQI